MAKTTTRPFSSTGLSLLKLIAHSSNFSYTGTHARLVVLLCEVLASVLRLKYLRTLEQT